MCVKFHDEEKRLEVNGGASCLYNDIQKLSIQNEDANFKGKTKTSLDKGTQRKTTENELPSLTQCTA